MSTFSQTTIDRDTARPRARFEATVGANVRRGETAIMRRPLCLRLSAGGDDGSLECATRLHLDHEESRATSDFI